MVDAMRGAPALGFPMDADVAHAESLRRANAAGGAATGASGDGDVAKQFEALLIKQVVKALRETVPESEGGDMGGSGMYDHFIEEALTSAVSDGGGLGLRQLFDAGLPGGANRSSADGPTALAMQSRSRFAEAAALGGRNGAPGANTGAGFRLAVDAYGERAPGGLDDAERPLSELMPPTNDPWLSRPDARQILQHILAAPEK